MTRWEAIRHALGLSHEPMTRKEMKQVDRGVRGNEQLLRSRFSSRYASKVSASHPWHKAKKEMN